MSGIIVAFPQEKDAKAVRSVLIRSGFDVYAVCTSGTGVLQAADRLGDGIIVCGSRLKDMEYTELSAMTAPAFFMLVIASERYRQEDHAASVWYLGLPLKTYELIENVRMLQEAMLVAKKKKNRVQKRSISQQKLIRHAQDLLMEQNRMTEEEAYRYLQRTSMDSGTGMVETAMLLISLMEDNT